jgi:membrane-associated phospholipid phosphatase
MAATTPLARPTRRRAALVSLFLCLLFFGVYGTTNYLTSLRHDVGAWVYDWERYIPFIPLMIVPYMSIDLFFVAAPFVCTDRRELRLLALRITAAVLVCGAFFLAMPLRFTFERPPVDGVLGVVFNHFREMDKPFNQFPSLHIVLRTILADLYARHAKRRWLRVLSDVWFSLIGASTLLVYQHHLADVVGGFVLAAVIFYVLGDASWRTPVSRNHRIGTFYCICGVLFAVAGLWLRPWGLVLLWPAVGCLVLTAGYFGLGPSVYRKTNGRLPLSTRVLLAPVLVAQYLSILHYARRSNAWDRVTERVWIGRALGPRAARRAATEGVTAVLDLTSECAAPGCFQRLTYLNIPILDLTAPLDHHFEQAVAFIKEHCGRENGIVYVHCKAGYSRSAAVVAAYLLRSGFAASAEDAVSRLRAARPQIIIRPEALEAIRTFHSRPAAGSRATDGSPIPL